MFCFSGILFGKEDTSFLSDPRANQISIRYKEFKGKRDFVFADGLGREVSFRGWNMSNRSKTKSDNYLPFKTPEEANIELSKFKMHNGGNLIRWLFIWSGIHPQEDTINTELLDNQIIYIKQAIKLGIHILIDFHQDLFGINAKGEIIPDDGPPVWILDALKLPEGKCGKICITWSQNYVTNKRVKAAFNRFWNNAPFETSKGKRFFQDEYFFMLSKTMEYLKSKLTPYEWDFIVGVDPINEPIPGDVDEGEKYQDWTNKKLFPFYKRVRGTLNSLGMEEKLVFSEPSTFWNVRIPLAYILIRPSGPLGLKEVLGPGFVFNAHSYDEVRDAYGLVRAENGVYLKEFELVREEAKRMQAPPILTEFGTWKMDKRPKINDPQRGLKANYQAMELSLRDNPKGKIPDFYSPIISGTQWAWEIVGYNDVFGHGICKDEKNAKEFCYLVLERAYPRSIQGDLMNFYYNDTARDSFALEEMNWVGIQDLDSIKERPTEPKFSKNKFALLTWRGKHSDAPSEIFLPRHFNLSKTVVMVDDKIFLSPESFTAIPDFVEGGSRLMVSSENDSLYHFALAIERRPEDRLSPVEWETIRKNIYEKIKQEKSILRLQGKIRFDKTSFRLK